MTNAQAKAMRDEIEAQNGPATLFTYFNPRGEFWSNNHHYIARDKATGKILGVLGALRDYNKMEPKRPSQYNGLTVRNLYTSSDAPHGTGTKLMQAAADRARRDGASFGVHGMVPEARPFYENLGGETVPWSSIADWDKEHQNALAGGEPIGAEHHKYRDMHDKEHWPERGGDPEDGDMYVPSDWSRPGSIPDAKKFFDQRGYSY